MTAQSVAQPVPGAVQPAPGTAQRPAQPYSGATQPILMTAQSPTQPVPSTSQPAPDAAQKTAQSYDVELLSIAQPIPVEAVIVPDGPLKLVVPSVHFAFCDGCKRNPIIGARYRCTIRKDYDLCSRCEEMFVQPHPMIKIYSPDQPIPSFFGDGGMQSQPVPGYRPTPPARSVVTRYEEEYHSPIQRNSANNSGKTTGNNSVRSSGKSSVQNSGKELMNKVMNLHPTVQANALKLTGTVMTIAYKMANN